MRFGVVIFPGSNCEQDVIHAARHLGFEAEYVWHGDTDLAGFDALVLPGGFSYGDYIRCGAVARFSPGDERGHPLRRGGRSGHGHLQRLPDPVRGAPAARRAAAQRHGLKFICREVTLRVEENACQWLDLAAGHRGAHPDQPQRGQLHLRRRDARAPQRATGRSCCATASRTARVPRTAARPTVRSTTSRASATSAATSSVSCRIPSASVDPVTGGTDGQAFFTSIAQYLAEVAG